MIIITPNRVRSIIADCKTDVDLIANLRRHKIRYGYTTDSGFLSVVIPCSTGKVRVYRSASKSNPYKVAPVSPTPFYYKTLDSNSQM